MSHPLLARRGNGHPAQKFRKRLPTIVSPGRVGRLNDSADNLFHRTLIMTLYSAAMRRAELCRLKVRNIDSQGSQSGQIEIEGVDFVGAEIANKER
jgi:integrase